MYYIIRFITRPPAWAIGAALVLAAPWTSCAQAPAMAPRDAAPSDLAELSIEQLMEIQVPTVVTASKHAQKVTDAPSSVTVITADDIKKYGYRTLADILKSVRGFYLVYDGDYYMIGLRGFNRPGDFGGRVLLMVDGHRINDPLYDDASAGNEFPVDVDLIDRVEIIRGPGSSLYGNNAFFAVINVITRHGHDVHGAEVSSEVRTYDTYKGRFTVGDRTASGLEYLLSGSGFDSEGNDRIYFKEFDSPTTHNGIAQDMDADRFHSLFGSLLYQGFTLEGGYIERKKDDPTAKYGTVFGDPRYQTLDTRGYAELKYDRVINDDWEIMTRAYYDYYRYHGQYPIAASDGATPDTIVINEDHSVAEWIGAEVQFSTRVGDRHKLTWGGEYRNDLRLVMENFDVDPHQTYLDSDRSAFSYAGYGQDEFLLLTNLLLNAGIRYDHLSAFGDTVNPRLALIYTPLSGTTVKLMHGQAFRAPNENEAFYQDGGISTKVNPDLKPERVTTEELVLEQAVGRHWRASASGFYTRTRNLIDQAIDPADGLFVSENRTAATAQGAEFELDGQWSSGLRGAASYSYTDTRDEDTGLRLDNSPAHLLKLNLIVPLVGDKLSLGTEAQYTGPRMAPEGTHLDGFWVANCTLYAQHFWRGLEGSLSVYNVFDQDYSDATASFPYAIAQQGRTYRAKLTYHF